MRDATERVRKYELMVILSPDVSEEDLPAAIDRVSGFVTTYGGTVTTVLRESPWGRRRLAYPIRFTGRDIRDGFYVLLYFDADSLAIVEIERELKLFDRLMRHMLILQVAPLIVPEAAPESAEAAPGPSANGTAPVVIGDVPADQAPAAIDAEPAQTAVAVDDAVNVEPAREVAVESVAGVVEEIATGDDPSAAAADSPAAAPAPAVEQTPDEPSKAAAPDAEPQDAPASADAPTTPDENTTS